VLYFITSSPWSSQLPFAASPYSPTKRLVRVTTSLTNLFYRLRTLEQNEPLLSTLHLRQTRLRFTSTALLDPPSPIWIPSDSHLTALATCETPQNTPNPPHPESQNTTPGTSTTATPKKSNPRTAHGWKAFPAPCLAVLGVGWLFVTVIPGEPAVDPVPPRAPIESNRIELLNYSNPTVESNLYI
jgi:hypothetical protein